MALYDGTDVCQSESESLYVVTVAGGDSVETVENAFEVVLADADAVVGNVDFQEASFVGGTDVHMERFAVFIAVTGRLALFVRIVDEVGDDIGKVHLVGAYDWVFRR